MEISSNNLSLSLSIKDIKVSEEENNKDEYQEMITLLSEMVFSAPYERYVINIINSILKNNYKMIEPLFNRATYDYEEIIEEFKKACYNLLEKENQLNEIKNSLKNKHDAQKDNSNLLPNDSKSKKKNRSKNKHISINDESKIDIFSSLKYRVSFDNIFYEEEEKVEDKVFSQMIDENKKSKQTKNELNDFLDTFNFNGKEYEIHTQILLMQILKCFEQKENSFKFLCNIEYNADKIFNDNKIVEFDFIINNLDLDLFKNMILYLKNNILSLKIREHFYEISKESKIDESKLQFEKNKKIDILGEIGLNALFEKQKIEQFKRYTTLLNYFDKKNNESDIFFQKTGFKRENEKFIFLLTNSNFDDIYRRFKKSTLYDEMKKVNVNFVLCYLSVGLNEKIILSNYLVDNKNKNDDLLNKIKTKNDGFIKSNKFKKLCYKLNELIYGINQIRNKFYNEEKKNLLYITKIFNDIILAKEIVLNKILNKYFEYLGLPIKDLYKSINYKKPEFSILYLKSGLLMEDNIIEKLNSMSINFETIIIDAHDDFMKAKIKQIKDKYKIETIYLIVCNYELLNVIQVEQFLYNIIESTRINKANSIFICNCNQKREIRLIETIINNIKIIKNENKLIEQINMTITKINIIFNGLMMIFKEKKYYDIFIKIYIEKTRKKITHSSKNFEDDFLSKINEILNFMAYLKYKENISNINDNLIRKDLFAFIDKKINDFINSEYENKIENIFDEISTFFTSKQESLNLTKNKTKDFCKNYLKKSILNYIYDYFILEIIPRISFNIYNKKVEKYLKKYEKTVPQKKISLNDIDYFEYL